MFKKILILIIIFSQIAFAGIRINEIMANPDPCPDKYCEWIELYNDGGNSINMTGWKISDNSDTDNLENYYGTDEIIIPGKGFALIVDEGSRVFHNFDVGKNVIWIYVDDDSIGGKLNNDGDNITIYNKSFDIVGNVIYEKVDEGMSYSLINNNWNESKPSPGKSNEGETKILDYFTIKINEFLPDPSGEDDAPMPNGEWVELYNSGNDDLDLLGFKFYDYNSSEPDVIITDTTTDGSTIIKKKDYAVIYMNGIYGFLNNNGYEEIKLYDLNDNLIDEVSYEGSKEGISWSKVNNIWQYGIPSPNSANKGNESLEDSEIKIVNVDDENKWNDLINIKLNIYKADTAKNSIKIYIEDENNKKVSEETSMNIYGKLLNYDLKLPVKIIDNCDNKFQDGEYSVVAEGLDAKDSEKIKIEGKDCKTIKENQTETSKKEIIVEIPMVKDKEEVKSETVIYHKNGVLYRSKGNEASRYALFFMSGISILLLLYFIFKNGNKS